MSDGLQPYNIVGLAISGVIYGLFDLWKKRRKARREQGGGSGGQPPDVRGGVVEGRTGASENLRPVKGRVLEDLRETGDVSE